MRQLSIFLIFGAFAFASADDNVIMTSDGGNYDSEPVNYESIPVNWESVDFKLSPDVIVYEPRNPVSCNCQCPAAPACPSYVIGSGDAGGQDDPAPTPAPVPIPAPTPAPALVPVVPASPNDTPTMNAGQTLRQGECLKSANGQCKACLETDGNFVIKNQNGQTTWSSQTSKYGSPNPPFKLVLQPDNHLILFDSASKPLWASYTMNKGEGSAHITLQDDCSLVLFDSKNKALWSHSTGSAPEIKKGGKLFNGQYITDGSCIETVNANHKLCLQKDGNVVIYRGHVGIWSSRTNGKGVAPYRLIVQKDNNVVLYDARHIPLWTTKTNAKGQKEAGTLVLNTDGNLAVYSGSQVLWASNRRG